MIKTWADITRMGKGGIGMEFLENTTENAFKKNNDNEHHRDKYERPKINRSSNIIVSNMEEKKLKYFYLINRKKK